ncbi:hypothetical protein D3C77_812770 [compost metagenome]
MGRGDIFVGADDAEFARGFQVRAFHLSQVSHALEPQLFHQFATADVFASQA